MHARGSVRGRLASFRANHLLCGLRGLVLKAEDGGDRIIVLVAVRLLAGWDTEHGRRSQYSQAWETCMPVCRPKRAELGLSMRS
jgi:ribosomal protein L13